MRLFSNKKNIHRFVIVTFTDLRYAIDYPKHLPLPRIGEKVAMEDPYKTMSHVGIVKQVNHSLMGNVHEIRIECEND